MGFARAILHRPQWLVLNEALEPLDVASRERIVTLLRSKLAGVGLINIGPQSVGDTLFTRRLHLVPSHNGRAPDPVERRESA